MNYPASNDKIHPDEAKYLYDNHCAIFILENLPPGSEFGVDLAAYRTGEKFRGLKLIPPGVHFVYACSVDRSNKQTLGPRCGFFHNFEEKEILLKRWSVAEEDFDDSFEPDDGCLSRYSNNLHDLDSYLGPYNFATYEDYKGLTDVITPETAAKLMPDCHRIRSVPYLTDQPSTTSQRIARASLRPPIPTEETIVPHLQPDPRTVIHFTRIPSYHLSADQDISAGQITQYNLDTTNKLEHCYSGPEALDTLLAEFQFAFVTFLLCHVYECFEQWKIILELVCHADSGLLKLPSEFFCKFIDILRSQFKLIPKDLFEDIVESNNLVRTYIDILLQNIESNPGIDVNLKSKAQQLKQYLEAELSWQFDIDDEEDQPVIVEL